ncbi:MAG: hypothetical protein ACYS1A_18085 [Planctomycetota bacterium]|jgi:hypothetical protein
MRIVDKYTAWAKGKPNKSQRKKLPKACFIEPERKKFPVCNEKGEFSCAGAQAAYQRYVMLRGKRNYPVELVDEQLAKIAFHALEYGDPFDPDNRCNWALKYVEPIAATTIKERQAMARKKRKSGKAVKREYIPGVGIRCRDKNNYFAKCSTLSGSSGLSGTRSRKRKSTKKKGLGAVRRIRTSAGIRCVRKGKSGFVKCPKKKRR